MMMRGARWILAVMATGAILIGVLGCGSGGEDSAPSTTKHVAVDKAEVMEAVAVMSRAKHALREARQAQERGHTLILTAKSNPRLASRVTPILERQNAISHKAIVVNTRMLHRFERFSPVVKHSALVMISQSKH